MQATWKLTSLPLSLCMVLGMLPMTVFAAGETTGAGLVYELPDARVSPMRSDRNQRTVALPSQG